MKTRFFIFVLVLAVGSFLGGQALAQMGQEEEGAMDAQQEESLGIQQEEQQPQMEVEQQQPEQQEQVFGAEEQEPLGQEEQMAAGQDKQFNRASNLIGQTVQNQQGEKLGTVTDIILSDQGQVRYLILSSGGFLGMGEKLIPVPWEVADATMQENIIQVNLDQQQLANAPSFKSQNWPNFSEPSFQQEVYGYYGEQPPRQQQQQQPGMQQRDMMDMERQPGMQEDDMMDMERQDQMGMEPEEGIETEEQQQY